MNTNKSLKLNKIIFTTIGVVLVALFAVTPTPPSKRKTKNGSDPNEQIVKLQRDDYSYEVGAGAEFFLEYFKFAIECKLTMGTKNLLIKDNTIYSDSVDKLNSKIFLISLTFEG